jgi:hypothetical protein
MNSLLEQNYLLFSSKAD